MGRPCRWWAGCASKGLAISVADHVGAGLAMRGVGWPCQAGLVGDGLAGGWWAGHVSDGLCGLLWPVVGHELVGLRLDVAL